VSEGEVAGGGSGAVGAGHGVGGGPSVLEFTVELQKDVTGQHGLQAIVVSDMPKPDCRKEMRSKHPTMAAVLLRTPKT